MTREEFVSYGVDYDAAMNMFMNNESIYAKFLGKFPKDESYKKLKEAIDNKDCESAFKAAHTLKGVAGNLSFKDLWKAASDVTEEFRAGNFEGGLKYIDELDHQYNRVMEMISRV